MWISIFKIGEHTDSNGQTRDWTEKDLDEIVAQYKPEQHEAPIVIGHPQENAPAWGWVESLKREGEILWAKIKDLVPEFKEMLTKKMFKKRSISLYPDLTLRHIGFLGATPPAVKGLPDFQFQNSKENWLYSFDFAQDKEFAATDEDKVAQEKHSQKYGIAIKESEHSEFQINILSNIFRRLREYFIEKFGKEDADRIVGEYDIQDLQSSISSEETTNLQGVTNMQENDLKIQLEQKDGQLKEFSQKLATKETEINQLKNNLEQLQKEQRKAQYTNFIDDLIGQGKLLPAQKVQAIELCEVLHHCAEFEFAEGKKQPIMVFQDFLFKNGKQIEFQEIATKDKAAPMGDAAKKLDDLVKQKMNNKNLNYNQAFREVQIEQPELANAYLAEIK